MEKDGNFKFYNHIKNASGYDDLTVEWSNSLYGNQEDVALGEQAITVEDIGYETSLKALTLMYTTFQRFADLPNKRVLDVCMGSGSSSRPYLYNGFDVHGIDGSKSLLKKCHTKPQLLNSSKKFDRKKLRQKDLSDGTLPYQDNHFAVSYSVRGLMYLRENMKTVQEMLRVTHPEGVVLIDLPLHDGETSETIATQLPKVAKELTFYIPQKSAFMAMFEDNNVTLAGLPDSKKDATEIKTKDGQYVRVTDHLLCLTK